MNIYAEDESNMPSEERSQLDMLSITRDEALLAVLLLHLLNVPTLKNLSPLSRNGIINLSNKGRDYSSNPVILTNKLSIQASRIKPSGKGRSRRTNIPSCPINVSPLTKLSALVAQIARIYCMKGDTMDSNQNYLLEHIH